MPSSPTGPLTAPTTRHRDRTDELLRLLAGVPDPRDPRGVRFALPGMLAVAVSAVLAGARSFAAIGEWASDLPGDRLAVFGLCGPPEESTLRKLFARLDAAALDRQLGVFAWTRTRQAGERRVIAIDGKTVRGARSRRRSTNDNNDNSGGDVLAPHLVAGLDHATGAVLGQIAVTAKSNEIPAVRELLAGFDPTDLRGSVITLDAMHTQTDTAEAILAAGADYVLTVKANQPKLLARLKSLPWTEVPAHRSVQTGHGRRATRTIKVLDAPAWTGFPGAAQIAQLRRTVTGTGAKAGKKTVEVVYLITSATHAAAPPAVLAGWVQRHWHIENRLHWVRDVTFDEDRSQARTGTGPQVMASLRNTAITLLRLTGWTNIAAGLRHHARKPERTVTCLFTC